MKAHELARELLAGENLPVVYLERDGCCGLHGDLYLEVTGATLPLYIRDEESSSREVIVLIDV